MDTNDLKIRRWGEVGDGYLGPAFHRRFRPGQVLYGSRRTYLRKVAVADFHGVCANTTFVVDPKDETHILRAFLPFVMTSEPFHTFAVAESKGSVNPYVNWSDIAHFEFELPPIEEQQRIADLLWSIEHRRQSLRYSLSVTAEVRGQWIEAALPTNVGEVLLGQVAEVASGLTLGPSRRALSKTVPYLRVANVQRGWLDLTEMKTVGATEVEINAKGLQRGDVLVIEGHASVTEIGRAAIWDRDESPLFQNHIFRVRPNGMYRQKFILEWINSHSGRRYMRTVAKSTSGLNTINSSVLKAMPIPSVSLEQQDVLLHGVQCVDDARDALQAENLALSSACDLVTREVFGEC
jgi:restriction endonuclease S subunit